MTYLPALTPTTDFLNCSFSRDDFLPHDIDSFLLSHSRDVVQSGSGSKTYFIGAGAVKVSSLRGSVSVSASGASLIHFRSGGTYNEYLSLLSEYPSNITRLDAALDIVAPTISEIRSLHKKYPKGVKFRSGAGVVKPTRMLNDRYDGTPTGTLYYGHRKRVQISAAIYDKSDRWVSTGGVAGELAKEQPQYTRYELRFAHGFKGLSLKDAADPSRLFYTFAEPFFKQPTDLVPWEPSEWIKPRIERQTQTSAQRLRRAVEGDALVSLFALSDDLEIDRSEVIRMIRSVYASSSR